MKRFILFICVMVSLSAFAQDIKKEAEKAETKMEAFASKTGVITKFKDYNLSPLKTTFTANDTRVRVFSSGGEKKYFYQIEKEGKYSTKTASIEYSDLLELLKALQSLKSEVELDKASQPDYLENKFVTEDGFRLGYYVSKNKVSWFIQLEKYGSDNTIFINDVSLIESSLNEAKSKIEELMKI